VVEFFKTLNHYKTGVRLSDYVSGNLIHSLFQIPSSFLLSFRAMLTTFDPLDDWFDVSPKLLPIIKRCQGINSRIDSDWDSFGSLGSGLYLENNLDTVFPNDIAVESPPSCR